MTESGTFQSPAGLVIDRARVQRIVIQDLCALSDSEYSPSLGRWMQQDPVGYAAGESELYRYVTDNPERFNDPSGTCKIAVGFRPIQNPHKDAGWWAGDYYHTFIWVQETTPSAKNSWRGREGGGRDSLRRVFLFNGLWTKYGFGQHLSD
jgi:hypothetical protein